MTLLIAASCGGSNGPKACTSDSDCGAAVCTAYGCVQAVTQSIGPSGGKLQTAGGEVIVEVPAGALASARAISIKPVGPAAFHTGRRTEGNRGVGTAFEIAFLTEFSQPLKITMSYAGLDLKGYSERQLCLLGVAAWGSGDEMVATDCKVDLSAKTVTATFPKGDKFLLHAFSDDWDATSRPTVVGTSSGSPGTQVGNPAPRPLPITDEFDGVGLDTSLWRFVAEESSRVSIGNGTLKVTASIDGTDRARGGIEIDDGIAERLQAYQSRIRLTSTNGNDATNRVRTADGMAYSTGIDPNNLGGFTGEIFAAVFMRPDKTVQGLVRICESHDCRAGTVIHSVTIASNVDVENYHDYALGFDRDSGTFYFRLDSEPVVSYQIDTSQYPIVTYNGWLWWSTRADALTNPGNKISIEVDRVKVGSLTDVFGTLP